MKIYVRSMIVASKGKVLVSADLSQAESWIVAFKANEANMKRALQFGDIHTETAGNALFHAQTGCAHDWKVITKGELWTCRCGLDVTKLMRYVGKRYNHACVDEQTEVLTLDGWTSIAKLKLGTKLAQWSETGEITFVVPQALHDYHYEGVMHNWQGHNFNQFVTPNHRMPHITNYTVRVRTSDELSAFKSGHLPIAGNYNGPLDLNELYVRLAVAIQADGMLVANKSVFHLKKERKIVRLKLLLENLAIEYRSNEAKDGSWYFRFTPPEQSMVFLQDKKLTYKFLVLASKQLQAFIDEVVFWDGSIKGVHRHYYSKYKSNAEIVKTIAHLCGQSAIIKEKQVKDNIHYSVSINARTRSEYPVLSKCSFNGKVYCVTVPTGFFLIRRMGYISVTGNSAYRMGPDRAAQVINKDSDKPPYFTVTVRQSKIFSSSWHNYYNLKTWWSDIERQLSETRSITTCYGRRRVFFGAWGNELFKEATAFEPQSTVADHFNGNIHPELGIRGGLLEIYRSLIKPYKDRCLINQSHDSFIAEVPLSDGKDFALESQKLLARPLVLNNETFTIPVDAEMGERWGELTKVE